MEACEKAHRTRRFSLQDYPTPGKNCVSPEAARLQRVQVSQQILHILRAQHLAVACHVRAAVANNVSDALVIRGQSGLRKILMLKYTFQTRTLFTLRGIRPVTPVAVVVINLASGCLLRVESELGVRFSPLHIAARKCGEHKTYGAYARAYKRRANPAPAPCPNSPLTPPIRSLRSFYPLHQSHPHRRHHRSSGPIYAALSTATAIPSHLQ